MNVHVEAARILSIVDQKKGAIKSLVFSSTCPNKRQLFALVCESLKYKELLERILQKAGVINQEPTLQDNPYLGVLLLYEYLLGRGLRNIGRLRKLILKHKDGIRLQHRTLLDENQVSCLRDLLAAECRSKSALTLPRYARVNMLKTRMVDVIQKLEDEGWKCKECFESSLTQIKNLQEDEFLHDPFLPDVLIFPAGTELHDSDICKSGEIILQDRASCFPAHILHPPRGCTVIDSCAAPGNKTSHLASLMNDTGKIFAFDRDHKRLEVMKRLMKTAGVTNTEQYCQDFLSVDPNNEAYANVEYILVDPSCSGSGIVSRLNHLTDHCASNARLKSLSNFQVSVLKHALRFPSVKRVVYSTCSIHEEENERVVEEVYEKVKDSFRLKHIFPEWTKRGLDGYKHADMVLRMSPEEHLTNGFFVACFESFTEDLKGMGEEEHISNKKRINKQEAGSTVAAENKEKTDNCFKKIEKKSKNEKRKFIDNGAIEDSHNLMTFSGDCRFVKKFKIQNNKSDDLDEFTFSEDKSHSSVATDDSQSCGQLEEPGHTQLDEQINRHLHKRKKRKRNRNKVNRVLSDSIPGIQNSSIKSDLKNPEIVCLQSNTQRKKKKKNRRWVPKIKKEDRC